MTVTSAARRPSRTPGYLSRVQLEDRLGLSATERDTFERAGIIGSAEPRRRGDTRPVLYSPTDIALAQAAMDLHRLGLRGEQLRRVMELARLKERRPVVGWTGHLVVDEHGDVGLVPTGGDLGGELLARGDVAAVLVVRIDVPHLGGGTS